MLFSANKPKNQQQQAEIDLDSINSDGINVSMEELIQYQNKSSLIDLTPRKSLHNKMSGTYLARSKGRGMEFDEVRHYQTGDDIRAIDWRVTARTGKTHTKLFREEVERPVLIATDLSSKMLFGSRLLFKSVQAAHIASIVAWHAKGRGDRVGGIVFNQSSHTELKPRSRKEGVLHYLHALVQSHKQAISIESNDQANSTEENSDSSLNDNCVRIRKLAHPGSLVYLITDGSDLNEDGIRHLSQVSRHCELVICLVTDQLEHELPQISHKVNVSVTDGTNINSLTLGDKKTSEDYKYRTQLRHLALNKVLVKSGARVVSFSAGETLESQLKSKLAS